LVGKSTIKPIQKVRLTRKILAIYPNAARWYPH